MRIFKEGNNLTLEDVRMSFQQVNNGSKMNLDLSRYPKDNNGAILFNSDEEYELAFGGTVSFEQAFRWK